MRLLSAVNTILPALGEHTVTSTDAKHPTVAMILNAISTQLKDLLLENWWFNTYDYEALPAPDGTIALPDSYLRVLPKSHAAIAAGAVKRGDRLYRMRDRSFTWPIGESVLLQVSEDLAFELLPETAAQYVMYQGCVRAYINDIGLEQVVREWQGAAARALNTMTAEHLENKRYSTRNSPRYQRYRAALRG